LGECLDILQQVCKYFIDISRYRDATGYIREGLDVTQLHYAQRRTTMFLLHQINADIVACCFGEASTRLQIVKNFLGIKDDSNNTDYDENDLHEWRNFIYMNYLELFKEIKQASCLLLCSEQTLSPVEVNEVNIKEMIVEKTTLIKNLLANNKKVSNLYLKFNNFHKKTFASARIIESV
jgi:hypothetical protein